jgi:hypothetical protein
MRRVFYDEHLLPTEIIYPGVSLATFSDRTLSINRSPGFKSSHFNQLSQHIPGKPSITGCNGEHSTSSGYLLIVNWNNLLL